MACLIKMQVLGQTEMRMFKDEAQTKWIFVSKYWRNRIRMMGEEITVVKNKQMTKIKMF